MSNLLPFSCSTHSFVTDDVENTEQNFIVVAYIFSIGHLIIHRDIKSFNIFLTENLQTKVANICFARQAPYGDSGMTHVSTQVKEIASYMDPEYLKTYQLTGRRKKCCLFKRNVDGFGERLLKR